MLDLETANVSKRSLELQRLAQPAEPPPSASPPENRNVTLNMEAVREWKPPSPLATPSSTQQGVHPSVMQKLAGHNSPKITLDIYTHVNMDQQRRAMEAMQGIFG